ncbi:MAG: tetratricopeptide repeat protein [Burkholderiaceae bacterium]
MRAKLVAFAGRERRDQRKAAQTFEVALRSATGPERAAAQYGSAVVALALEQPAQAASWLAQARETLARTPGAQPDHPFLASLDTRIVLAREGAEAALATLTSAAKTFPDEPELHQLHAELLLRLGRNEQALAYLEDLMALTRSDTDLWRLLADARAALGQTGLAHWATAERYALLGGWAAAVQQLNLAVRDSGLTYYELSQIDARRQHFESELLREREER